MLTTEAIARAARLSSGAFESLLRDRVLVPTGSFGSGRDREWSEEDYLQARIISSLRRLGITNHLLLKSVVAAIKRSGYKLADDRVTVHLYSGGNVVVFKSAEAPVVEGVTHAIVCSDPIQVAAQLVEALA